MYEPREDSHFIKEIALKYAKGICLDLGCGTGIIGNALLKNPEVSEVHFSDISQEAIDFVKRTIKTKKKVKFFVGDLFENVNCVYDCIVFNPPYLPGSPEEDPEIYTSNGNDIILRFIKQVRYFLKENGVVVLLYSQFSKPHEIKKQIYRYLFDIVDVYEKQFFFETLYVVVFKKSRAQIEILKKYDFEFYAEGWRNVVLKTTTKPYRAIKVSKHKSFEEIEKEYKILKHLNDLDFVPKVYDIGCYWFSMDFIEGVSMKEFIELYRDQKINFNEFKFMIVKILDCCHLLDKKGIKKEELNRPTKNIILSSKKPFFIDFDKARRGIGNVTEFMSFLINNFPELLKQPMKDVINVLKDYKKSLNIEKVYALFRD